MSKIILSILAFVSALLTIRAEYLGPDWQKYLFKPLTLVLIILIVILTRKPISQRYRKFIIGALCFSLIGDMLLILPYDLFLTGLIAFLIAQIIYTIAFLPEARKGASILNILPFLLLGSATFIFLAPHLTGMFFPVLIYLIIIYCMSWSAWSRWGFVRDKNTLLAALGASFFLISDTSLAINRFYLPFATEIALTLTTYYLAQWLLAISVDRNGSEHPGLEG